jgi:6-phosphogluconate dehydrogenase
MAMQLGMIGSGRMGASMVRRLMQKGHDCVVYARRPEALVELTGLGASGTTSLTEMVSMLKPPRSIWLMIPAAAVDAALLELIPLLDAGDTVIDGGNSYYRDDCRRSAELGGRGIHYLDAGTSGGIAGLERGYCVMVGGPVAIFERMRPIFEALAPGIAAATPTAGRKNSPSSAEQGYLHCGGAGAGHFVKMVHNGIEYGIMAAYAEGFNILRHANSGAIQRAADAETAPLLKAEFYHYPMDLAEISELWRRGSVIGSWLLDLTAAALQSDPDLSRYTGEVADSGEGRWTIEAAIDESVPAPVLSAALFQRFASRGQADFANQVLSAMRHGFGGHLEKSAVTFQSPAATPSNPALNAKTPPISET